MHFRAFRFAARGVAQLEGPERQVHVVAGHVAQRALAEVPPAAPLGGMITPVGIGSLGRWAQPEVPVQLRRRLLPFGRAVAAAPALADPDVDFGDVADRAGLNDFDDAAIVVLGVDLRAQLRGDSLRCAASATTRAS